MDGIAGIHISLFNKLNYKRHKYALYLNINIEFIFKSLSRLNLKSIRGIITYFSTLFVTSLFAKVPVPPRAHSVSLAPFVSFAPPSFSSREIHSASPPNYPALASASVSNCQAP